jgi:N-acetylglucosaminyl-diphospho-decaprenol L-rhamnosyltransferase
MLLLKPRSISLSVVSHGHAELIRDLVQALATTSGEWISKVIVTSNSPSLDDFSCFEAAPALPFVLELIHNVQPLGFGANHNQAFRCCDSDYFCVINPDIEILKDPFAALLDALSQPGVSIAYPAQVNEANALLDFERELVGPSSIARRHVLGQRYRQQSNSPVHWVSGAFMVFNSSIFRALGGFDERYFMYCEDVDICLRAQLAGYGLARADATVTHHTRRSTLKSREHLAWHVRSLLRLWTSAAYRHYKRDFVNAHN